MIPRSYLELLGKVTGLKRNRVWVADAIREVIE